MALEALGSVAQVQLDNLGGAGTDQEQGADLGPACQHFCNGAVQFLVAVGHTRQITLSQYRSGEPWFGENHHPGGGLDQVRAGASCILR